MSDFPSLVVPSFDVVGSDSSNVSEEALLSQEEAEYEEKLIEIRAANSTLIPIGKVMPEDDPEEFEKDGEDEEGDNGEEESEA